MIVGIALSGIVIPVTISTNLPVYVDGTFLAYELSEAEGK